MVRRMLIATVDNNALDQKDYYGNKRLQQAGSVVFLLIVIRRLVIVIESVFTFSLNFVPNTD
jgi:hypothetical protein